MTPPAPPPRPTYVLQDRAAELLDAVEPLRRWRNRHLPGANPPPELKPLADLLDRLAGEVYRYVGERLEPAA